ESGRRAQVNPHPWPLSRPPPSRPHRERGTPAKVIARRVRSARLGRLWCAQRTLPPLSAWYRSPLPVRAGGRGGGRGARGEGLLEPGDRFREAGLGARGGVGVDDLLLGRLVDDPQGLRQQLARLGRIAARHRLAEALDGGAQARALRPVLLPLLDVLTVPLLSRLGIRHKSFQEN